MPASNGVRVRRLAALAGALVLAAVVLLMRHFGVAEPTAKIGVDNTHVADAQQRFGHAAGSDAAPSRSGYPQVPGPQPPETAVDASSGAPANNPESRNPPATPAFTIEEFQRRFAQLAAAGDWPALEDYIVRTLHKDAPSLQELWPIMLAALEELGDRAGYDPVGRGVSIGLQARRDLRDCADMLNASFLETESLLVRIGLASPLTQANRGRDNTTLKLYIEKLLVHRDSATRGAGPQDRSAYWDKLILAHTALARSVLDTIEFVESLRPGGLPDTRVRGFWSDCCVSAFYYRHYEPADVPRIVDYLIAHTDESLSAALASDASVRRLKLVWERFREDEAYERGLKRLQELTDAGMLAAWDAVLAHWLSSKKRQD